MLYLRAYLLYDTSWIHWLMLLMVWVYAEVTHVIGYQIQAMAVLFSEHVLLLAEQVFAEVMVLVDSF